MTNAPLEVQKLGGMLLSMISLKRNSYLSPSRKKESLEIHLILMPPRKLLFNPIKVG
jgi:hypothetical protein